MATGILVGPASCRSPTKGAQPCAPTDRLEACPTSPHQLRWVSTTGAKLLRIGIVATNRVRQHMTFVQKNRKASLLWQNTSSQAYYCEPSEAISRHSRGDGNPGRAQSHAPLHDRAQFKVCRNIKNGESMKKVRPFALIIVVVILSATLASCGLRGGAAPSSGCCATGSQSTFLPAPAPFPR